MRIRIFRKMHDIDPSKLDENSPYIAGLIDGEGSFIIHKSEYENRVRFSPMIVLGMTHEETVKTVADHFGVSCVTRKRRKPLKHMYVFLVRTLSDIKLICETLYPHSITKRKQMELFLKFVELKNRISGRVKHDNPEHKHVYLQMVDKYIELRKLNERGPPPDYESMRERLKSKVEKEFEFVK